MKRLITLTFFLLIESCASISDGTLESRGLIYFSSIPSRAEVRVNGTQVCQTPCQYRVNNGEFRYISFEKDGFRPVEIDATQNEIRSAIAGNLIFGGGIGLGLDLLSGRAVVSKDSINVVFEE
jgi:hypothetical protein